MRKPKRSKVISENETEVLWRFVCEACEAEGELTLFKKDGMKPFGCPENCGATYIPWHPQPGAWQLRCVVMPCFR